MQPIMRIILPIIGVLIAASLASPASRGFDAVFGAAVGFTAFPKKGAKNPANSAITAMREVSRSPSG
jgi:hypothetical protein